MKSRSRNSDYNLVAIFHNAAKVVLRASLYNQLISSSILSINQLEVYGEICHPSTLLYAFPPTVAPSISTYLAELQKVSSSVKSLTDVPLTSSSSSTYKLANIVNMMIKPSKSCPDFKDDPAHVACCISNIDKNAFFCCTREQKALHDWEMSKAAWRQFAQDHLPSIIIGSLFTILLFLVLMTFLCKRFSICPLYRSKSLTSSRELYRQHRYSFAAGRYHRQFPSMACNPVAPSTNVFHPNPQSFQFQQQTASIIHKAPAIYEAPPPYEFIASSVIPPTSPLISTMRTDSIVDGSAICTIANINAQQRAHELDCLMENEINNIHQSIITDNQNTN